MTDVLSMVRKAVAPIHRRVMLAVGRAVIQAARDDEGMQVVKLSLLKGELRDRVERMQEYGFTSRPLDGCEAVAVFVGGDRGHGIVVATDDRRHRKRDLEKGEAALYTDEGDYILLKRGRIIEVVAGSKLDVTAPETVVNCDTATVTASTKVTLETPEAEITGNVAIGGNLDVTGTSTLAGIVFGTHVHPENDNGGPTGPPQ